MFENELYEAKKVAIIAGKKILSIYRDNKYEVNMKEDETPVTEADIAANNIIVERLKEVFPSHAILSEESEDNLSRLTNDYCWIIDPIDGTKEFVNRTGEFTVNIALAYKNEIVVGVIYVPVLDELYYASKNDGAYLVKERNYQKLNTSNKNSDLIIGVSRSHMLDDDKDFIDKHSNYIKEVKQVGSTLKGCFLARGILDIVHISAKFTKEWDIAAMSIIVKEAGGIIRSLKHEEFTFNKNDIINKDGYYLLNNENTIMW